MSVGLLILWVYKIFLAFRVASQVAPVVKNPPTNAGDVRNASLIPGLGKSPAEGHGNPLQYSCLEKSYRQRSLAGYSPRGCKESDLTSWLSTHTHQLYSQFCVPRAFEKQGYILQFGGTPRYPKALWGTMRLNYSISEIKLVYCLIQFFYILTEFFFLADSKLLTAAAKGVS